MTRATSPIPPAFRPATDPPPLEVRLETYTAGLTIDVGTGRAEVCDGVVIRWRRPDERRWRRHTLVRAEGQSLEQLLNVAGTIAVKAVGLNRDR